MQRNRVNYRQAGVSLKAGAQLVQRLKPLAKSTARPGASAIIGGFAGGLDLAHLPFEDPLLLATADGVGTKLKLAFAANAHDTIGVDLVAMCVNDLVAQGATPLAFLDYFALGRLRVPLAMRVLRGIARACRASGCALIGGETAEMPDFYADGEYELAGFALGAVERKQLLPRPTIRPGDVLLGLASDGLHANGFALVRRILEQGRFALSAKAPFEPRRRLGRALLAPTRLYVTPLLRSIAKGAPIKALAHITGGGWQENLPRVLPADCGAQIEPWPLPPVFGWLAEQSGLGDRDLLNVFNCGVGMAVVVAARHRDAVMRALEAEGERVMEIGAVVPRRKTRVAWRTRFF